MTNYMYYIWVNGDKANIYLNGRRIGNISYKNGEWGFYPKTGKAKSGYELPEVIKLIEKTYHTKGKGKRVPKKLQEKCLNLTEISYKLVGSETLMFLDGLHVLSDRVLGNHIYDIDRIMDDIAGTEPNERPQKHVVEEIKAIKKSIHPSKLIRIIKTK